MTDLEDAASLASFRPRPRRPPCLGMLVGGMKRTAGGELKDDKPSMAMAWCLSAGPDEQDVVEAMKVLPMSVRSKVRLFEVGHGTRRRCCALCEEPDNSVDPILGSRFMLMWAHLDSDGVSVLGLVDFYCLGVMRRRWPGWKLADLAKHFNEQESDREKHKAFGTPWGSSSIGSLLEGHPGGLGVGPRGPGGGLKVKEHICHLLDLPKCPPRGHFEGPKR